MAEAFNPGDLAWFNVTGCDAGSGCNYCGLVEIISLDVAIGHKFYTAQILNPGDRYGKNVTSTNHDHLTLLYKTNANST